MIQVLSITTLSFTGVFNFLVILIKEDHKFSMVWSSCHCPSSDEVVKDFKRLPEQWQEVTA